MADSYTRLSSIFQFPPEASHYATTLATFVDEFILYRPHPSDIEENELSVDALALIDGKFLKETSGCTWKVTERGDLFVYGDDYSNIHTVISVIHATMRKFQLDRYAVLEYADLCNRPIPGEFGGGVALISKDSIEWVTTSSWAEKRLTELETDPS